MEDHNINNNLKKYIDIFKAVSLGKLIWRIAIYVRLSKDDGNSVSLSIVNQIKIIARYLREFEDFFIFDIYVDDGKTGTDFERADYKRLVNDVYNGFVNCIIVKDVTRFSRNMVDGIKELESLVLDHKVRFISLSDPAFDTYLQPKFISSGELYNALQHAESHARATSERVRLTKGLKRDEGEKNGGFPPYGYLPAKSNEQHWQFDPVASIIVKRIFNMYLEGISAQSIAKRLNNEKIPNPTTYKQQVLGLSYSNPHALQNSGLWHPSTVRRILEDKNYIGCSVQGKSSAFDHKRHKQIPSKKSDYVVVENSHPKTISNELFEQVDLLLKQKARASKNGEVHLFANLVYCSDCKKAMKKTGAKTNYLVCRTNRELSKEYCKTTHSIKFDLLKIVVLDVIKSQISLVCDMKQIVDQINSNQKTNSNEGQSQRIEDLLQLSEKEFSKTERILDDSYYDLKNGLLSEEQYRRVKADMECKLQQLRDQLQNLAFQQSQLKNKIVSTESYFQTFLKYKNVTNLNRPMLLELVDKIYIKSDKSVTIEFRYNDQYMLISDYINQNKSNKDITDKKSQVQKIKKL